MLKDLIVRNQEEIVICKEGVFGWDGLGDVYEYIGEFDIRKIHRKKCVEILEDRVVFKGEEIKIVRNGHYDIEHEEVIDVGSGVKIEMFTIIKDHSGEELTIPNNPGLFRIYEVDLALINYIDKYKF